MLKKIEQEVKEIVSLFQECAIKSKDFESYKINLEKIRAKTS